MGKSMENPSRKLHWTLSTQIYCFSQPCVNSWRFFTHNFCPKFFRLKDIERGLRAQNWGFWAQNWGLRAQNWAWACHPVIDCTLPIIKLPYVSWAKIRHEMGTGPLRDHPSNKICTGTSMEMLMNFDWTILENQWGIWWNILKIAWKINESRSVFLLS